MISNQPNVKIVVSTPVFSTENEETILQALLSIFPDTDFHKEKEDIVGEPTSLLTLKKKIYEQKIRDSTRSYLEKIGTRFLISKQSATVGKVSFVEEPGGTLGEIRVAITGDEEGVKEWLAERTTEDQNIEVMEE